MNSRVWKLPAYLFLYFFVRKDLMNLLVDLPFQIILLCFGQKSILIQWTKDYFAAITQEGLYFKGMISGAAV